MVACSKGDAGVVAIDTTSKKERADAATGADVCPRGEETCRCRSGANRCDEGLECRSGLCVEGAAGDDDVAVDDGSDDDAAPGPSDDDVAGDDDPSDDDGSDDDDDVPADDDVQGDDDTQAPAPVGGSGPGPEPTTGNGGTTGTGGVPTPAGNAGATNGGTDPGPSPAGTGGTPNVPGNLIQNGNFAEGDAYWDVNDGGGGIISYSTSTGALCTELSELQPFVALGWPLGLDLALTLDTSSSYELSYEAWTSLPSYLLFEAKAGEAVSPYSEHFLEQVSLSTSPSSHAHVFSPASSDPTGIVFLLYHTDYYYGYVVEVCVDNVVLRQL